MSTGHIRKDLSLLTMSGAIAGVTRMATGWTAGDWLHVSTSSHVSPRAISSMKSTWTSYRGLRLGETVPRGFWPHLRSHGSLLRHSVSGARQSLEGKWTPLLNGRSSKERAGFWIYHTGPNLVTIKKNEMFYQFWFYATYGLSRGMRKLLKVMEISWFYQTLSCYLLLNVSSLLWAWSHNCTHMSEQVKLHSLNMCSIHMHMQHTHYTSIKLGQGRMK